MRNTPFWWILIGFMLLLDFYVFQALKVISQSGSPRTRLVIFTVYWFISLTAIVVLIILPYLHFENQSRLFRNTIFACIAALFFAKIIASFFFFIDDVRRGVQWLASKISFAGATDGPVTETEKFPRSVFLSWTGMILGGGLFGSLLYGFNNKYRYQLKRFQMAFESLPSPFKGMKIVHISDIHVGSFTDKAAVIRGVEKILNENPDIIFFSGDLVNNKAEEMKDYMDVFSRLKAPMGVYSILGNHDYGDYFQWDTKAEKIANLERVKQLHAELGWRLLVNENVELNRNGEKIVVIGIENWSAKARFSKYGSLKKAFDKAADYPFKILLSHDPSHWDAEVRTSYPAIDLTLSGHTHGMQFGVEIPGFKWSPVQYIYKQWAGLYEEGTQKLYVNRGFGFIGYPGRVGILPEITVIELV